METGSTTGHLQIGHRLLFRAFFHGLVTGAVAG